MVIAEQSKVIESFKVTHFVEVFTIGSEIASTMFVKDLDCLTDLVIGLKHR